MEVLLKEGDLFGLYGRVMVRGIISDLKAVCVSGDYDGGSQ